MLHRKLAHHLFPHFFVSKDTLENLGDFNLGHHRAHALSLPFLFIYLLILLIVGAGVFFLRLQTVKILGTATFSAQEIINMTNEKRVENGLKPLSSNSLLTRAAEAKAGDMFSNNYWAHNSPQGKTPWTFFNGAGYKYIFAGENLARDFDNPREVVNAWMNSPSHRSNLLDRNFKEIGVAVVPGNLTGRDGILVVQMFGSISALQSAVRGDQAGEEAKVDEEVAKPVDLERPQGGLAQLPQSIAVLAYKNFSLARGISLGLVGFIFALFALEVLITLKREHVKVRVGVVAHLALLGFVLLAVWYATEGAIL